MTANLLDFDLEGRARRRRVPREHLDISGVDDAQILKSVGP